MFKYLVSRLVYSLLACALLFHPHAAQAGSVSAVTFTSASGFAYFGGGPPGCSGVCFYLSNPTFGVSFDGFVPSPYYQATAGYPFEGDSALFNSGEAFGAPSVPAGYLVVAGVTYPAIFSGNLQVTGDSSFIVPYSGTTEVPAELTGSGFACTGATQYYGCSPSPANPNPVLIADIDLDIPGYLTFDFYPGPGAAPDVGYSAKFTPIPEPSTLLLLLAAVPILAWLCRGRWRSAYVFIGGAVLFTPALARPDSLPTVLITSATGSAAWGDYNDGCRGICAGFSNSIFGLGFDDFAPAPYFQASPGSSFAENGVILGLTDVLLPAAGPTGGLVFGGIEYPVAYQEVVVMPTPFLVPYGGTIEVPALLTGSGTACTAVYPGIGCYANSPTTPPPVMIANVDLDIPGYLIFTVHPSPETAPALEFTAIFRPIPEPLTVLLVLPTFALIWARKKA